MADGRNTHNRRLMLHVSLCGQGPDLNKSLNSLISNLGMVHLISWWVGGGWDFSSQQVIFFSLLAQKVIFFPKVNCNEFLITHLNQKNVNESNTLNEKCSKNLKFLFDH